MSFFENLDDDKAKLLHRILDLTLSMDQLQSEVESIYSSLSLSKVWDERKLFEIRVEIINSIVENKSLSSSSLRHKLKRFFKQEYQLDEKIATRLSNRVESTRKKLHYKRENGFALGEYESLYIKQNGKCAHCKHQIRRGDIQIDPVIPDVFRPYHWEEFHHWLDGEVDHTVPISRFGTERIENLELFCKACNAGKKAGLIENYTGQSKKHLEKYESTNAKPSDDFHSLTLSLVYYRILVDERKCVKCKQTDEALTIRLCNDKLLPSISNVRTLCYSCI